MNEIVKEVTYFEYDCVCNQPKVFIEHHRESMTRKDLGWVIHCENCGAKVHGPALKACLDSWNVMLDEEENKRV